MGSTNKKVYGMISALTVLIVLTVSIVSYLSYANNSISVLLNGKELSFDAPPFIEEGRTLVPFRSLLEGIGASVAWDSVNKKVTATKSGMKIVLSIGSTNAVVNNATKTLDVPAQITNGRTFVPIRFVSENLGIKVNWLEAQNQIELTTISAPSSSSNERVFTLVELSKYNGQNGNPSYVAVDGIVYDVSNNRQWRNGMHNGATAGSDLSSMINSAPHGKSILKNIAIIGVLK